MDYLLPVLHNHRLLSPRQLLSTFNMLPSVKILYQWRTRAKKADQEAILSKGSSIVEAWESRTTSMFEKGPPSLSEYLDLLRLFYG